MANDSLYKHDAHLRVMMQRIRGIIFFLETFKAYVIRKLSY